ncbi:hypothetical protein H5410_036302, partial [Solanum commersonii]
QQHDYKNAELSRSEDFKNPELRGTRRPIFEKQRNANLNQLFEKTFTQKTKNSLTIEPQTSTYADSLQHDKKPEIQKIEIPNFYANKRIIGISTIIQELANNYLNGNSIWSYYSRDQLMIYANSRELRKSDMDEAGFISSELLTRYCELIGHKYPDHICSKCNGEDNVIPDVQLE